jgi:molybdopterin converting factor small subunit
MSILVKLSASLRNRLPGYDPHAGLEVPHRPGLTVGRVMEGLGLAPEEVKIMLVNGVSAEPGTTLAPGDRLALFPAVGGG